MKHIGKRMIYFTQRGEKRTAKCTNIEFHQGLGKPVFLGISPFGNEVRLTKSEIHSFVK